MKAVSVRDKQVMATGKRVLAALSRGRQIAIERAQARSRERAHRILLLAAVDVARGNPARGRVRRIARQLGAEVSERHVRRLLRDALSRMSDSPVYAHFQTMGGHHA